MAKLDLEKRLIYLPMQLTFYLFYITVDGDILGKFSIGKKGLYFTPLNKALAEKQKFSFTLPYSSILTITPTPVPSEERNEEEDNGEGGICLDYQLQININGRNTPVYKFDKTEIKEEKTEEKDQSEEDKPKEAKQNSSLSLDELPESLELNKRAICSLDVRLKATSFASNRYSNTEKKNQMNVIFKKIMARMKEFKEQEASELESNLSRPDSSAESKNKTAVIRPRKMSQQIAIKVPYFDIDYHVVQSIIETIHTTKPLKVEIPKAKKIEQPENDFEEDGNKQDSQIKEPLQEEESLSLIEKTQDTSQEPFSPRLVSSNSNQSASNLPVSQELIESQLWILEKLYGFRNLKSLNDIKNESFVPLELLFPDLEAIEVSNEIDELLNPKNKPIPPKPKKMDYKKTFKLVPDLSYKSNTDSERKESVESLEGDFFQESEILSPAMVKAVGFGHSAPRSHSFHCWR